MQNSEFAHDPESFAQLANVAKNALKEKNLPLWTALLHLNAWKTKETKHNPPKQPTKEG